MACQIVSLGSRYPMIITKIGDAQAMHMTFFRSVIGKSQGIGLS